MPAKYTDAELLGHRRNRSRWIVRLALGSLLILLLLLVLGGLALFSSGMSIEEAEAVYERLRSENATLSIAKRILGKATESEGRTFWTFTQSSFDSVRIFIVLLNSDGVSVRFVKGRLTLTGWDAWKFRWQLLKTRLGFDSEYKIF